MSEYAAVTLATAWMLDAEDLAMGFHAGAEGEPEPLGSIFSLSYHHGWQCGQVGAGLRAPSPALAAVAYAFELAKSCTAACDTNSGPCLPTH